MISILGNIQPFKPMLKYQVSLHVQNLNFILILGSKLSEKRDYKCRDLRVFAGKFLDVTKYACVKDLTNIMSVDMPKTLQTKCKTCFGGPKSFWNTPTKA